MPRPNASAGNSAVRAEIRATIALAWPLILGNFAQTAINTTDVLILGRYDVGALAGAAIAVNLYFAFGVFAMGLVTAASPMIAAERGRMAHSVRDVRRTVRQAIWASAAICIPIWLILWHAEALLLLIDQDPVLSANAAHFIRICMWGLFPFLTFYVLRYYVTALEKPLWGLYVTAAGVGFNALACWALVFGRFGLPELGLTGAAIANFAASCFLALGMVAVVVGVPQFRRYRLFGRWWLADWPRFFEIQRIGLPIAATFALEITVFNAAVFLMGLIDRASLAAHAIAIQIAAFGFMIPLGLGQAATVRVGLWHGRGDADGIARAGAVAFLLGIGAAFVNSAVMVIWPGQLIGLFIVTDSAENIRVFSLAVSFLLVAAVFQLVDGAQAVGAGALRGLQDTRWPMIFAGFSYWVVGFGVAVWLGFGLDMEGVGIWIGLAAGLAVAAVLMVARWFLRARLGLVDYLPA